MPEAGFTWHGASNPIMIISSQVARAGIVTWTSQWGKSAWNWISSNWKQGSFIYGNTLDMNRISAVCSLSRQTGQSLEKWSLKMQITATYTPDFDMGSLLSALPLKWTHSCCFTRPDNTLFSLYVPFKPVSGTTWTKTLHRYSNIILHIFPQKYGFNYDFVLICTHFQNVVYFHCLVPAFFFFFLGW